MLWKYIKKKSDRIKLSRFHALSLSTIFQRQWDWQLFVMELTDAQNDPHRPTATRVEALTSVTFFFKQIFHNLEICLQAANYKITN